MALFEGDFVHRPLYLDRGTGTADQLRTAPQLVWLDRDRKHALRDRTEENYPINEAVVDKMFALVEERHAVVFWLCKAGGDALYRHLRTINMVNIPEEAAKKGSLDPRDEVSGRFMPVLFRHADPNVLAQVMPVVDRPLIKKFLGPAESVVFLPDDKWSESGKILQLTNPQGDIPVPVGPICLSADHINQISLLRARLEMPVIVNAFIADNGLEEQHAPVFEKAIQRAYRYGLRDEQTYVAFLKLERAYGPDFEFRRGREFVLEHLQDRDMSAEAKLACVVAELQNEKFEREKRG
ncbi:hypothetical protein GCM10011491_44520 [Brucella endophytica]|uniref:DUF4123 domain-containing protein n=2 Tax=Brucella endophytica TaxID=1963359 RepID=A0A916SSW7_9HYPH|nr:hypothetical protein GCM10011491_44520 [Brucella endophytica]